MSTCLFCKIVSGEIGSEVVYENENILAFKDASPQAPVHILLIPKQHIVSLNEVTAEDMMVLGDLQFVAAKLAGEYGIAESGYRTVMNCNADGGQTVFHLHLHLLGGREMQWPPG